MTFNNYLFEKVVLPLGDVLNKQSVSNSLNLLQKSQWWSNEQLEEYQNNQLQKLINHSYKNVQYYYELFNKYNIKPDAIKNKTDLIKIPILTKEILRKNIKNGKLIARNLKHSDFLHASSSGSTGEPIQYFTSRYAYGFNLATAIRAWYWMGYRLGDKYIKISQYDRPRLKKIQDFFNRCEYLPAKKLDSQYFQKIAESINSYKPKIIRGYPDQMLFLTNYIKNNDIAIFSPLAVTTTGSNLRNNARDLIESVFRCKVFDSYRCEGGANVSQCDYGNYHSSMEYAITEILGGDKEVKDGEKGRLITTDLQNFVVPFIRYDSQDIVTKSILNCPCGRGLNVIQNIDGRDSDFLITPAGKFLIDVQFDGWFPEISCVEQYQVVQSKLDHIVIKLVVNNTFNELERKRIENYWQSYIGKDVLVQIEVVESIPLTSSGKRRYLIRSDEIKLPF